MKRALFTALAAAAVLATAHSLRSGEITHTGYMAYQRAQMYTWHGSYYYPAYGGPVALVVPPTAGRQTDYHWGVAGYRTTPIYHQFRRGYPGTFTTGSPAYALPTPLWPSDTNQLGVYYVRAPW